MGACAFSDWAPPALNNSAISQQHDRPPCSEAIVWVASLWPQSSITVNTEKLDCIRVPGACSHQLLLLSGGPGSAWHNSGPEDSFFAILIGADHSSAKDQRGTGLYENYDCAIVIGDAIALIQFLRDLSADVGVLSAIFDADGNRKAGDEGVSVKIHRVPEDEAKGNKVWFYEIHGPEGFEFVRAPVNPEGVIEAHGTRTDGTNPDARYFRYAPVPDGNIYSGSRPNVRVDFMVFGYKPEDLLKRRI